VCEQRLSGRRTGPAYDPVVRPFDPAIAHVPVGLGYGTESDALEVEPGGWIERAVGIRGPQRGHALSAHEVDQTRALRFVQRVSGHRELRHPLARNLYRPRLWGDSEQRELDRRS